MVYQGYNGKQQKYIWTLQAGTLREVSLAYHLLDKELGNSPNQVVRALQMWSQPCPLLTSQHWRFLNKQNVSVRQL